MSDGRQAFDDGMDYAHGKVAEQRCERGTPWDMALVAAMNAIKPGSAIFDTALFESKQARAAAPGFADGWAAGVEAAAKVCDEAARSSIATDRSARYMRLAETIRALLPVAPEPGASVVERARAAVCDEILAIMAIYDEQEKSAHGVDTPGGLEHMGDVWRQLDSWRDTLSAALRPATEKE